MLNNIKACSTFMGKVWLREVSTSRVINLLTPPCTYPSTCSPILTDLRDHWPGLVLGLTEKQSVQQLKQQLQNHFNGSNLGSVLYWLDALHFSWTLSVLVFKSRKTWEIRCALGGAGGSVGSCRQSNQYCVECKLSSQCVLTVSVD